MKCQKFEGELEFVVFVMVDFFQMVQLREVNVVVGFVFGEEGEFIVLLYNIQYQVVFFFDFDYEYIFFFEYKVFEEFV